MSEPTNLKLGKFGSAGNINIDTLKGGVNINDFGQEHITIFKAYDVDKNDILTDNEVQQLKNDVQKYAKQGKNSIFSDKEAENMIKDKELKGVNSSNIFEFLKQFTTKSRFFDNTPATTANQLEDISETIVQEEIKNKTHKTDKLTEAEQFAGKIMKILSELKSSLLKDKQNNQNNCEVIEQDNSMYFVNYDENGNICDVEFFEDGINYTNNKIKIYFIDGQISTIEEYKDNETPIRVRDGDGTIRLNYKDIYNYTNEYLKSDYYNYNNNDNELADIDLSQFYLSNKYKNCSVKVTFYSGVVFNFSYDDNGKLNKISDVDGNTIRTMNDNNLGEIINDYQYTNGVHTRTITYGTGSIPQYTDYKYDSDGNLKFEVIRAPKPDFVEIPPGYELGDIYEFDQVTIYEYVQNGNKQEKREISTTEYRQRYTEMINGGKNYYY